MRVMDAVKDSPRIPYHRQQQETIESVGVSPSFFQAHTCIAHTLLPVRRTKCGRDEVTRIVNKHRGIVQGIGIEIAFPLLFFPLLFPSQLCQKLPGDGVLHVQCVWRDAQEGQGGRTLED